MKIDPEKFWHLVWSLTLAEHIGDVLNSLQCTLSQIAPDLGEWFTADELRILLEQKGYGPKK